ncbi:M14 family zinc carboxypeptidase [Stratiformator vulcanicus]|nr:M14 family zinc carboxypeptidase [Stratiformator vulcanicus]
MKVPYVPSYHAKWVNSVRRRANVTVHDLGRSVRGHTLSVIELSKGGTTSGGSFVASADSKPCLLIYAREHADEHDSSWAVEGFVESVLAEVDRDGASLLDRFTILAIPLMDPDGAAEGAHDSIMNAFRIGASTVETDAYARFLQQWVDDGNRLDLIVNIHNPGVAGWHAKVVAHPSDAERQQEYAHLKARLDRDCVDAGFIAAERQQPELIDAQYRMCGWASRVFGPGYVGVEVNSRSSKQHLTLDELRRLGDVIGRSCCRFLETASGRRMTEITESRLVERKRRWAFYYGRTDSDLEGRSAIDVEMGLLLNPEVDDWEGTTRFKDFERQFAQLSENSAN